MKPPSFKKRNSLFRSLQLERTILEEKIECLLREKRDIKEKINQVKTAKIIDDLRREREELAERIERLQRERQDVVNHIKVEEIIGELRCPKDYRCYKKKFNELCKAELIGENSVLRCLEENPQHCTFSLSYKDIYYCQCPLRTYIAEQMEI